MFLIQRQCGSESGECLVDRESRRVAQALDLAGITNTVRAPFLRVFCEGRESEMPAPSGFDHVSTAKSSTRSIAAHP